MDKASLEYCRSKILKSGSSFYYSTLFLAPNQKQAIMAVYAFRQEVKEVVDKCTDKDIAHKKLLWWHDELERVFLGNPEHPIGKVLMLAIRDFELKKHLFEEILQGMMMDLTYQGYQTFEDLRLYCHCVASAPSLLAAQIFGFQDPDTLECAKNAGVTHQLITLIRDIGKDALRGRVYLPETELAQFSLSATDILNKCYSDNFYALMQHQMNRAQDYYKKAITLPEIDKHAQASGLIMTELSITLLQEIEKNRFQVHHQKISLTPLRKLWIAWKTDRKLKNKWYRRHTIASIIRCLSII